MAWSSFLNRSATIFRRVLSRKSCSDCCASRRREIAPSWDQERQIERLLELFLRRVGLWRLAGRVYRLSDALWLDKVLVNRQERAVSLGAILLWIAQRLALPVVPVIFPTQMLLRADPETSRRDVAD